LPQDCQQLKQKNPVFGISRFPAHLILQFGQDRLQTAFRQQLAQ
jgi:hypothetical protein